MASKTRRRNKPEPEAAGPVFQRLSAELVTERRIGAEQAAEAAELRRKTVGLVAEAARLEAQLAQARRALAQAEQGAQASQQRCGQLGQELGKLRPRLRYNFDLPSDADLAIIARLGVARCRAARACRGFRAAVGSAKQLGAFRHRISAIATNSAHTVFCTGDAVLSFGCGEKGQLGYAAASQAKPRVVTALLDQEVVAAAATEYSTLVCTAEGQAYWFGQLHTDSVYDGGECLIASEVPRLVGGLPRVVGVAAGAEHLLAWTQTGQLYTWGAGRDGQLGHGSTEHEAAPRLVEGLAEQQVVGGAGGYSHSVVCTASGRVYTFGFGREQLGHGQEASDLQLTPRVVEGLAGSTVAFTAASTCSTAAVTAAGELYTWGRSVEGGLGHGEEINQVFLPRLVAGLAGKRVAGVAARDVHMLAWTDSGELYSWGCGTYGQLGHKSTEREHSPRRVEALAGHAVVRVALGPSYSLVVTARNQVFAFGLGHDGRPGYVLHDFEAFELILDSDGNEIEPVAIPIPKEVEGLRIDSAQSSIFV